VDDDIDFDLQIPELNSNADKIEDLLDNLLETGSDDVQKYFQKFDYEIPAEEYLTEEQIINLVQLEKEEGKDNDSSDKEIPSVSMKEAISGLETVVTYFQQQTDPEFNVNDLCVFQKYLKVFRVQEFNSKKQITLDTFFEK